MPPIVWQLDVPGTQTVTDVNGSLNELLVGPPLTTIGAVFTVPFAELLSHCGEDVAWAIRRSVPTNRRRGTRYRTTFGDTPAGTRFGA